tara:strand:+ start:624 stop:932 length:309 start_codon:yes stop_codon:yes gene_type:complete
MATTKVKGTSKKIKEIKGEKPEKVSQEHLTEIQKLVSRINHLHAEIGRMEAQKHINLHTLAGANDEMTILQDKLNKEYGTTDINVQSGEINYDNNGGDNKKD